MTDRTPDRDTEAEWTMILLDALTADQLRELCGRLDIQWPGTRASTVSRVELAAALAEAWAAGTAADRKRIGDRLEKAHGPLLARVRAADPPGVGRLLTEDLGDGYVRPGVLIWAIRADGRPEIQWIANAILDLPLDVDLPHPAPRKAAAPPKPARRPEIPASIPPDLATALHKLRGDMDSLIRRVERALGDHAREVSRREQLEHHVEELKRETADREQKLAAARATGQAAATKTLQLEQDLEQLRARKPSLTDRDARKLVHEREQLTGERDALRARVATLEGELKSLGTDLRAREEEAGRLREERDAWRARAQATPQPARVPEPSRPPDPARAAVLVDTQTLYFPSRRRHARINYAALREAAAGGRKVGAAIAYVVETPGVNSAGFMRALRELGYQIRTKTADKADADTAWTSGLEAEIAEAARKFGRVAVATQNPGLAPAVEAAGAVLLCFQEEIPPVLRAAAGELIPLADDLLVPIAHAPAIP